MDGGSLICVHVYSRYLYINRIVVSVVGPRASVLAQCEVHRIETRDPNRYENARDRDRDRE